MNKTDIINDLLDVLGTKDIDLIKRDIRLIIKFIINTFNEPQARELATALLNLLKINDGEEIKNQLLTIIENQINNHYWNH